MTMRLTKNIFLCIVVFIVLGYFWFWISERFLAKKTLTNKYNAGFLGTESKENREAILIEYRDEMVASKKPKIATPEMFVDDNVVPQDNRRKPEWLTRLLLASPNKTFINRHDKMVTVKDAPIKIMSAFLDARLHALDDGLPVQVKILTLIHHRILHKRSFDEETMEIKMLVPIKVLVDTGTSTHTTVENVQVIFRGELLVPFCGWRPSVIQGDYKASDAPIRIAVVLAEEEQVDPDQWMHLNVLLPYERNIHGFKSKNKIEERPMKYQRNAPYRLATYLPLLYGYTDRDIPHLFEFIETYKILGVDKFLIYDYRNVSENYAKALHYLQNKNDVYIIPWSIDLPSLDKSQYKAITNKTLKNLYSSPFGSEACIKKYGMNLQYYDVSLRYMNMFDYIIMADFDEIFVPRKHATLIEVLDNIDKNSTLDKFAGFRFPESCYTHTEENVTSWDVGDTLKPEHLNTGRLYRSEEISAKRSKSLIRPARALQMSTHVVKKGLFDITFTLDSNLVSKHHYREAEECKPPYIKEESTALNQNIILERVESELNNFVETLETKSK